MTSFTFVRGDTWSALYVDGQIIEEGDHYNFDYDGAFQVLKTVGGFNPETDTYQRKFADLEWLDSIGNFPSDLSEVQFEGD